MMALLLISFACGPFSPLRSHFDSRVKPALPFKCSHGKILQPDSRCDSQHKRCSLQNFLFFQKPFSCFANGFLLHENKRDVDVGCICNTWIKRTCAQNHVWFISAFFPLFRFPFFSSSAHFSVSKPIFEYTLDFLFHIKKQKKNISGLRFLLNGSK